MARGRSVAVRQVLGTLQALARVRDMSLEDGVDSGNFGDVFASRFTTTLSDGRDVELVPGGAEQRVTLANRREFVALTLARRIAEAAEPARALVRGLASQARRALGRGLHHDVRVSYRFACTRRCRWGWFVCSRGGSWSDLSAARLTLTLYCCGACTTRDQITVLFCHVSALAWACRARRMTTVAAGVAPTTMEILWAVLESFSAVRAQ